MTTVATPEVAATSGLFKTYTETYVRIGERKRAADGTVSIEYKPWPESKATKAVQEFKDALASDQKAVAEAAAKGESLAPKVDAELEPTVDRQITFLFYEIKDVNEILELVPNQVEACNLFNRGVVLKEQMAARDYVMDEEFSIPEGVFDLKSDAAELHERRKASPEEKALKALSKADPAFQGISVDEFSQLLAAFKAQRATA